MYQDGVLLLCGANANGHYWNQFIAGEFSRRRMVALQANDGYKLWARDANYMNRPIVMGNQVLAEPWIYDLRSGVQKTRKHPITGAEVPWTLMRTGHHCGMFTGADSGMLMFRSGDTAFFDMETESGVKHFAGHRLGCWINAIPAEGLVMIPEASAGCVCQFSIAATIVMEPREPKRDWAIHSAVGALLPVKQLLVNFGAPGDRRDPSGEIWLAFPRPRPYRESSLDIELPIVATFANGTTDYWNVRDTEAPAVDVASPWLFTSGAEPLSKLSVPLRGSNDGAAVYDIKLYLRHDGPLPLGAAIAKLGGEVIESKLDVVDREPQAGGGAKNTVLTAKVKVAGDLVVDFVSGAAGGKLCALEVRVAE
jgi:hypothetical protein